MALGISYWVQKSAVNGEELIAKSILPAVLSLLVISTLSLTTISQMTHWKDSVTLWNRVISLYPEQSWSAYFSRAEAHLELKNFDAAISDFTKVIQLNPYYYYGHYRRGASHFLAGDYRSAVIDFSSAIKLNDRIVEGFYYRGEAYRKLGETTKANRDSTAAYRLMRSNPEPFQG
jgi:tetratricopeptide (TPR) repeat protein